MLTIGRLYWQAIIGSIPLAILFYLVKSGYADEVFSVMSMLWNIFIFIVGVNISIFVGRLVYITYGWLDKFLYARFVFSFIVGSAFFCTLYYVADKKILIAAEFMAYPVAIVGALVLAGTLVGAALALKGKGDPPADEMHGRQTVDRKR